MDYGLTEKQALKALTEVPASMLGISDKVGTLAKGKMANFIITSDDLFKKDNIIYENWVEGRQYVASKMDISDLKGAYALNGDGLSNIKLNVTGTPGSYVVGVQRDSTMAQGTFTRVGRWYQYQFRFKI